jgi:hypothetical protein
MSEEDRRLNRLTFWSVYFLDVSLSFGVGRETAFRLATISQTPPTENDFESCVAEIKTTGESSVRQPSRNVFSYAAKLAYAYGPVVNVVNGRRGLQHSSPGHAMVGVEVRNRRSFGPSSQVR